MAHHEKANFTRMQPFLQVNDIVTACIQIKSDAIAGKVAKLLYQSCIGLIASWKFLAMAATSSRRSTNLMLLNLKPMAPTCFYFPPMVHPCKPLDTPDLCYTLINLPAPHPLQNACDIQLYNEQWLDTSIAPLAQCPHPTLTKVTALPNCLTITRNSTFATF